ncbi:beta-galactosidase [Microbacterium horticulturae]|uniref:Beta-galactosidase n=1 Tax=Microbacterium horticulturae TaxID=3028316 RepID=A0ABY8BVE8_9MICO|nr:beta-galactosidase [Microbacterium sp. KACC 23027]WEG08136.1 beta-galactosidase [Microbacterium sp. KACC 23027]
MTRNPRPFDLGALAYGGDYNPDQWSEDLWAEDIALMQEAGVNIVTLPVFSWPQLETSPGVYDWAWLDRIIDLLWAGGIHVDLATATATPPSWLLRAHPEMLPMDADGRRLAFGSRQAYCPSSPVWHENVARLTRAMAERYGEHPAVVLWHVSNEYGDHTARCWCPESSRHFRRWLQERYGTLERLNDAWGVNVWGQRYTDWEHIEAPRRAPGPINPTQLLDFERFSSDALLDLFRLEVDILHAATPDIPVTTNFMSMFRELDYWRFAEVEDLVTDDAYPDPADSASHVGAAWNYGLMRSLKAGRPWLLLEQSASAVSWRDVNVPKPDGKLRSDSLQAIAHGSDGAMFFQWRQARYGQEKFHSAMLGQRGARSRTFAQAKALGAELTRLAPVRGTRVRSRAAIIVDWDAWWGSTAAESLPSQRLNWARQVRAYHRALHALGHPVDAVRATGPFDGYDLVLAPNLYIADAAQVQALTAFVEQGGHVVVGPFSGVVDTEEKVHPGGAPGPLRALLGVEVDEQWPIADGQHGQITCGADTLGFTAWAEWLEAGDAEVRGTYGGGDLDGRPAITRRAQGAGSAWYISAMLDDDALQTVFRDVLADAGLPARERVDQSLDAVTRSDAHTDYTFVLNHGRTPLQVVVPEGHDLLTDTAVAGVMQLPAFGAAVIAAPRADGIPFLTLTDSPHTQGGHA